MPENTEFSQNSKSNSATILLPLEWSTTLDRNSRSAKGTELAFPAQIFLSGKLPNNRSIKNLPILIEREDGEYIVSEQQFYNHAARESFDEAINAFVHNLSDAYDSLLEEETNLGEHLQEELEYFRKVIVSE